MLAECPALDHDALRITYSSVTHIVPLTFPLGKKSGVGSTSSSTSVLWNRRAEGMSKNDSGVDEVIWACSSGVTNLGGVVVGVNIMADAI